MILVDTSILIDFLRGSDNDGTSLFDRVISSGIEFGINNFIYQEILQGSKTQNEFSVLQQYLSSLPFYDLKNGRQSFEKAAELNYLCRKSGITVRSTVDLLIAETAIENDLFLLHNDNDFTNMAKCISALKIYR